jgi:membrane-associated phospholipid phosphatase
MKHSPKIFAIGLDPILAVASEWLLPERMMKRRVWPIIMAGAYVLFIALMGGLRSDHIEIAALVLLDSYNPKTRLFLRTFFPFILTGVVYDLMRYFYWQGIEGHVHVAGPYLRDLTWFGISAPTNGLVQKVTPNEFFAIHHWTSLDLLCGFAYLVFVGEYLMTAFYLFFSRKFYWLKRFGWSFLMVNVMGFITYFIYPAAPPWYVSQYGLGPARMDIHPTAAAAARFDQILGTHFFDQIYSRGVDVYGAYPSLHVTYPFLVMLTTFQITRLKRARVPAVAFYLLMCLSAVYLQHHYVVDILLGTAYATFTWIVLAKVFPPKNAMLENGGVQA